MCRGIVSFTGAIVLVCLALLFTSADNNVEANLPSNRSKPPSTESEGSKGGVVKLSYGDCFYRIDGNANPGNLVVLVHGFIGSHLDYSGVAKLLVSEGRRVLRMDNYGRGWSTLRVLDSADDPALYSAQLAELLLYLGETGKIDLVGYSLGGAIVSHFAKTHPEKIATLGLLAPAATSGTPLPLGLKVVQSTLRLLWSNKFGRALLVWLSSRFVDSRLAEESLGWTEVEDESIIKTYHALVTERVKNEPRLPYGLLRTIMSHFYYLGGENSFDDVAKLQIPSMVIWGKLDEQISSSSWAELRRVFALNEAPLVEHHLKENGHMFPIERPSHTTTLLVHFWHIIAKRKEEQLSK